VLCHDIAPTVARASRAKYGGISVCFIARGCGDRLYDSLRHEKPMQRKTDTKGSLMRVLMLKQKIMVAVALSLTAGCAIQPTGPGDSADRRGNVPEAVIVMAAPDSDVATARLVPADGCYWYEPSGPVETTLVPLRTVTGNRICTPRSTSLRLPSAAWLCCGPSRCPPPSNDGL